MRFDYASDSGEYTAEREQEIVQGILGRSWMWYTATSPRPHVWDVAYGFDSSD